MRDATPTTANAKAIADFASKAGLQYVGFDWKRYGTEDPEKGDATTVRVPNLDIPEVVQYAAAKGVAVSIYADRRQIKKPRDILFPRYEKWGVKAVKIGFVDVEPQTETAWITETLQKAAEHHLVLDIHDGYRLSGNNRTYPNPLTVEGIRGNEHMPTPEHNARLPFTRYALGIGDYTVCYYTPRKQTTFAHQLAMGAISFSPMQRQAARLSGLNPRGDGCPPRELRRSRNRVPVTFCSVRSRAFMPGSLLFRAETHPWPEHERRETSYLKSRQIGAVRTDWPLTCTDSRSDRRLVRHTGMSTAIGPAEQHLVKTGGAWLA